MMPKSPHVCHAIGCSEQIPLGIAFCQAHHSTICALPSAVRAQMMEAHQRFYRVENGNLVRNISGDAVRDAETQALYANAVAEVAVAIARAEGKPLPPNARA